MKNLDREEIIVKACENKKAEDIVVLDIREKTTVADCFIIAEGRNYPQLDAIKDEVDFQMSKAGYEPLSIEGDSRSGWLIIDYGDIVVHIFDREKREFYNLERLWTKKKADKKEAE